MKLSVAVMAHPKRAEEAEKLYEALIAMPFNEEDVAIVYDNNNDEWSTGKRSLEWGIGLGDWHLVIQDDAVLTPFFYENLISAIQAMPVKTLLSLYTGQARPWPRKITTAVNKSTDGDFLRHFLLIWGVAIVIPTEHIQATLEFAEGRDEPYDTRIGMMYHGNMLPVLYTMPSLVDHNDGGKSLLEGHGILPGERIAHRPATGKVEFIKPAVIDM